MDIIGVNVRVLPFLFTTCESGPEVAESALWGGKSAVAARSRKRKAHLHPSSLCNAEPAAPRDSAQRNPSPVLAFRTQPDQKPRGRRRCSRGEDRRATLGNEGAGPRGRAGEPSPAENNLSHTGANQELRELMAVQTQTNSWRERPCRRLVSLCQSWSRHGRGCRVHRQEGGHVSSGASLCQ